MRQITIIIVIILCLAVSVHAETEDAVFAILKLSYNTTGETPVTGGICGTAFLINDKTLLTAYHVLNEKTGPNPGFKYTQFWLLKRGKNKMTVPLENATFKYFPDIDTTVINLKQPITDTVKIELQNSSPAVGDAVFSIGHAGGGMPAANASWVNTTLVLHDYSLQESNKSDKTGFIMKIIPATVHSNDVNITDIVVIKPSFTAVEGMSGGPLLNKKNDKLVGLMSFGLPTNKSFKDEVFAIDVTEIIRKFKGINMEY